MIILLSLLVASSCQGKERVRPEIVAQNLEVSRDTILIERIGRVDGDKLLIEKDVDLKGSICVFPKGITLYAKGGIIRNGVLVGQSTKIGTKGVLFDRTTIKGSWNVPEISTRLFAHLDDENALRNVVALASPKVQNKIVIEKGNYRVKAMKSGDVCMALCSNTDLVLNGTVKLVPNNYKSYNIIQVKGKNISITGKGTIIGDKHTHTGTTGEWGMGVRFHNAINASINGLTIRDCWGDCIYVGGSSRNVTIEKCILDHGRRQGISVTKANGVTIRNCMITNVGGTAPEYAIDIEPNKRDFVDNIRIVNVTVRECEGGLLVTRGKPKDGAKTPWIGSVTIRNCQVSSKNKRPIVIKRCEEVKIEKCSLCAQKGRTAIAVTETGKAVVQNNIASIDGGIFEKAKNSAKKLMGKAMEPIHVETTGRCLVKNNQIVER